MTHYTQVPCPNCQRPLRVRREYSGKVIACKYCEHAFHPKVAVACPSCHEALHVRLGYLGQRITCRRCDHTFRAPLPEDAALLPASTDEDATALLTKARLEVAALDEQAARLRADLDAAADRATAAEEESTRLRAQVAELEAQKEQARIDLAQAAGLRSELDQALLGSRLLDERTQEVNERTREAEALRAQLRAAEARQGEFAHEAREATAALQRDLDAVRQARAQSELDRETLAGQLAQAEAERTALTDQLRAARDEAAALRHEASRATEDVAQRLAGEEQSRDLLDEVRREHERERAALADEVQRLRAEIDAVGRRAHEQAEAHRAELARAAEAEAAQKQRHTDLTRQYLETGRKLLRAQVEVDTRRKQMEEMEQSLVAARGDRDRLAQELNAAQAEAATMLAQGMDLAQERDRLVMELEDTQIRLCAAEAAPPPPPDPQIEAELAELRRQHEAVVAEREAERQAFRAEAEKLQAEMEKFRAEAEEARRARDRVAAESPWTATHRADAEVARRFEALEERLRQLQGEVERPREAAAPEKPRGALGRLWGSSAEIPAVPSGTPPIDRRLDGLKADAAIERERHLRQLAEAAKSDLERQLAGLVAQLKGRAEGNGKKTPPPDDVIPLGYGGEALRSGRDAPPEPPALPTPTKTSARPRRVEDLF